MTYGYYLGPDELEPSGTYFYNDADLEERSLIGAASLIYHELVPGHHFQQSLLLENRELTRYRREAAWHDAFIEGWGEYASTLADEAGMYSDPYDLYGHLGWETLTFSRLVVDTGLNHFGWSRDRARDFLRAHTLAWPGRSTA